MRPTDTELFAVLYRASWAVLATNASWTMEDRKEIAEQLQTMAKAIRPLPETTATTGAAEHYRPGVYNGD
jgi:hypothetical protein